MRFYCREELRQAKNVKPIKMRKYNEGVEKRRSTSWMLKSLKKGEK